MAGRVLPDEVCARIVRFAAERDLPALCRTSRLLQTHAEARLYRDVLLRDPRPVAHVCAALLAHAARRAALVRRLWICLETRLYVRAPLPAPFWRAINDVLPHAHNLELLYVADPEACGAWLADPAALRFRLRDATFPVWDKPLVAFLQTQHRLQCLAVGDAAVQRGAARRAQPVPPGSLPALVTFDGPLAVACELLASPLQQVHAQLDEEDGDVLLTFLSRAARACRTLSSFDAVVVPEFLVCHALRILAASPLAGTLRHIGVLSLPLNELERCDVHRSLLKFSALEMVQLDVSTWNPPPPLFYQRALTTELRMYCPSVRFVLFWLGHHQFLWRCDNEQWNNIHAAERRVTQDNYWRNF